MFQKLHFEGVVMGFDSQTDLLSLTDLLKLHHPLKNSPKHQVSI